jgi:putative FmdB family regulatory protein
MVYEYECTGCGHRFEAQQTIAEHDKHEDHEKHEPLKCPECGSKRIEQRVPSAVYVITSKKS